MCIRDSIHKATLTTHGHRVERRRRRQQHARADGFGRGGAATAWAAAALSARARRLPAQLERGQVRGTRGGAGKRGGGDGGGGGSGTRGRTGSDGAEQRPPGRPLLRLPRARRLRSSSAVRRREAWRRAERDCRCRGAAVMWRGGRTTSARRTGRSSSASRAALKSRPSMGGEKPVGPRPVGGRTRFVSASKSGFARSATLGLPRKASPVGMGLTGRPNSHLAGLLMFS